MPHRPRLALLLAGLVASLGCQHMPPQPLDLRGHQQQWMALESKPDLMKRIQPELLADDAADRRLTASAGLTLAEAQWVALALNPRLRVERLEAQVPAAGAAYAGLLADPALSVDLLRILENVEHPWVAGGGIGFTLPLAGRLGAQEDLADVDATLALQEAALAEWQVLGELRQAWRAWSLAEERAVAVAAYASQMQEIRRLADRLAQAGEVGTLESRLLHIEHASASLAVEQATMEAGHARRDLLALLGLHPAAPIDLVPELAGAPGDLAMPEDIHVAILQHPEMVVAKVQYEVAEQRLCLALREQYPNLTIGPVAGQEEGNARLGLGVQIPIPLFNRNRRNIAEAAAARDAARANAESAYERITHAIAAAEANHVHRERIRRSHTHTLQPLIDGQLAHARGLVEAGELDALLLQEVLRQAFDLRLQRLKAAAAAAAARDTLLLHLMPTTPAVIQARSAEATP